MANACIFCQTTDRKITSEHIFAEWVDSAFPGISNIPTTSIITASSGSQSRFIAKAFDQKVRVVCDVCNNGWMNDLEMRVAPILGPMIGSQKWTRLSRAVQATIARWAVKTALILQHLNPNEIVVPASHYFEFFASGNPVPGHIVLLAHRRSLPDSTGVPLLISSKQQPIDRVALEDIDPTIVRDLVEADARIYRLTFTVGYVAFVVFGHTFPNLIKLGVTPDMARIVRPIWPVSRRSSWPPPLSVEAMGGIDGLHKSFEFPMDVV